MASGMGFMYDPTAHADVESDDRSSGESDGSFDVLDPVASAIGTPLLEASGDRKLSTRSSTDRNHPYHVLRETGSFSSVVNLTNSIIGSGILGLPFAFSAAGWILGYMLILGSAVVTIFSLHLLSLCATKVEHPSSFYKVTNAAIPSCTFLVDASVASMCFGVAVSYLIVIGGLMPDVMKNFAISGFWEEREVWIIIGFAIVAPLSCFKNLDALKWTSALAVFFVIFIALMIVTYAGDNALDKCEDDGDDCVGATTNIAFSVDTIRVLGVFVYAYSCQMNIFPVYNELRNHTQKRINNVIYWAIGLAFVLYCTVAGAGYSTYGEDVESNVLISYPKSTLTSVARIFISLLVAFSYPLLANPGRNSSMELWRMTDRDPLAAHKNAKFRFIAVTFVFLFGSFGVAMILNDLGVVLALIGATGSTVVTFILPGAAYYVMFKEDDSEPKWKLIGAQVIFVFGCIFMPVCLVFVFL